MQAQVIEYVAFRICKCSEQAGYDAPRNQLHNMWGWEIMKKTRKGYVGGLCDPNKAFTCTKEHCAQLNKGDCRHTTRIEWFKTDKEKGDKNE